MAIHIKQIGLVSAISLEISNQYSGIKINQTQLGAIVEAANLVCAAFIEKKYCDSCNDKLRGGCLPTCAFYQKGVKHD